MRIIPALLLLFSSLNLKAQDTEPHYRGLQFNVFPGFLIAHREYMANMEAHSIGFELIYSSDLTGWKTCDEQYKKLRWGTGITYFGMGNRELNGRVYAWHIHVEANLKKREKFQSTLRFGSGIGYLDRPFEINTNKKNKAIGSRLNGNMQVIYKAYFELNSSKELALGLGVTHYSNGNFRRPNLGINMAHASIGLVHKMQTNFTGKQRELPKLFPDNGFEIHAGLAQKQISVADQRFFTIMSSGIFYYFRHNQTRNWRAGIDVFFDKTYSYSLFRPESIHHVPLPKMTELAAKIGHEFHFGRVAVITDLGTYLYRPADQKKRVYFSIGFNYFFNHGFSAQTRLKSHLAVADYFYWSGGYRFSDSFLRKK